MATIPPSHAPSSTQEALRSIRTMTEHPADILRSLIVLDTETTASGGVPHLLELAALCVVDGDAVSRYSTLVRAEVPIDPESQAIHGITDEDLFDAPPPRKALTAFQDWVETLETGGAAPRIAWAHAARSDARVMAYECARNGLRQPTLRLVDGVVVSRRLFPDLPHHDLESLVDHFGIEWDSPHRALPDAAAAWQVAEHCLAQLGGWGAVGTAALLAAGGAAISVEGETPRPPRRHRAHARRIESARREGLDVELLYAAKGAAPTRLVVAPRLLYQHKERAYLEGECRASGLWKTYRLDRVQRAIPVEGARQEPERR